MLCLIQWLPNVLCSAPFCRTIVPPIIDKITAIFSKPTITVTNHCKMWRRYNQKKLNMRYIYRILILY